MWSCWKALLIWSSFRFYPSPSEVPKTLVYSPKVKLVLWRTHNITGSTLYIKSPQTLALSYLHDPSPFCFLSSSSSLHQDHSYKRFSHHLLLLLRFGEDPYVAAPYMNFFLFVGSLRGEIFYPICFPRD